MDDVNGTNASTNVYEHAQKYHNLGLSIVPIKPGEKHPFIKWKPYQTKLPSEDEIDQWFQSGASHIGLITGALSQVVAVDADDEEAIAWVEANLPKTPLWQKTKRGAHYFYLFVPGVKNRTKVFGLNIDIRGEAGIIVLAPSKDYTLHGSLEDFNNLPPFPTDIFLKPEERQIEPQDSQNRAQTKLHARPKPNNQLIREAKSLIMRISPDCPRDVWRSVGMALKSLDGSGFGSGSGNGSRPDDSLFNFWDDWSRSSETEYPHEKNHYQWESFRPGDFNMGNIIQAVKDYGDLDIDMGARIVDQILKTQTPDPKKILAEGSTVENIMDKEIPPIKWLVNGFLIEGLTIVAGRSKVGKSFLCLDLLAAVAQGEQIFNSFNCQKKTVVYVSLEDGLRRLKGRMEDMDFPRLTNAIVYTEMPKIGQGGIAFLRGLKEEHSELGMIIIDIMEHVLPPAKSGSRKYEEIYPYLVRIQKLAEELKLAIVMTHHTKKGIEENVFDEMLGSMAIQGAADELIVIKRKYNETKGSFSLTCRDFGDKLYEVEWDADKRRWKYLGAKYVESENVNDIEICKAIAESVDQHLMPNEIVETTGLNQNTVRNRLKKMVGKSKVLRDDDGYYSVVFA